MINQEFTFSTESLDILRNLNISLESIPVQDFNHVASPIIIYQMGKVGSSTIQASLKKSNIPNSVFHCHHMSNKSLDKIVKLHAQNQKGREAQFLKGVKLRKLLNHLTNQNRTIKIISLVRETIGLEISAVFENLRHRPALLSGDGSINKPRMHEFLLQKIRRLNHKHSYFSNWFDMEFNGTFGLDIYAYPYDYEKRYSIINDSKVSILLMRLEDISEYLTEAMDEFLKIPDIAVVNANIGTQKRHYVDYSLMLKNLRFTRTECVHAYSGKCFNHFYSETEKEQFIKKWST